MGRVVAVLHGNRQPGNVFSYAFFIPAGVWDPPHSHTASARITVVRGELRLGYGARAVPQASTRYTVGSYLFVPAGALHYDGADIDTIIVGTAVGPWATDYAPSTSSSRRKLTLKLDAILLDYDGLILDTEPVEFAALSAMFSSHGAELAFAEWHVTVGSEGLDWFSRLASPGSPSYDELHREFSRRQSELLVAELLRPGIRELLENAREASVPVAVVTSGTRDRVQPELERRDLLDHIAFLITVDDVIETKPSPEPYMRALDRLDADPARSVAFEDSSRGVTAAVAAGMRCVAVYNDTTREHDFEAATHVCDRLDRIDLSALVSGGIISINP